MVWRWNLLLRWPCFQGLLLLVLGRVPKKLHQTPSFHKHTPNGPGGSACASGTSASWSFTVQPLALREPTQGNLNLKHKARWDDEPPPPWKILTNFLEKGNLATSKIGDSETSNQFQPSVSLERLFLKDNQYSPPPKKNKRKLHLPTNNCHRI